MTVDQIVTVIALILGPVFAVVLTLIANKRAFIRGQRVYVFQTLMAFRKDPFNAERIKALGLIDVVFHDSPRVRLKWKEFYDELNNPAYRDGGNNASEVWKRKENEMLSEMAIELGYGRQIGYEQIERSYAPQLYATNAANAQKMQTELLRVLENSEIFGVLKRRRPPG